MSLVLHKHLRQMTHLYITFDDMQQQCNDK